MLIRLSVLVEQYCQLTTRLIAPVAVADYILMDDTTNGQTPMPAPAEPAMDAPSMPEGTAGDTVAPAPAPTDGQTA